MSNDVSPRVPVDPLAGLDRRMKTIRRPGPGWAKVSNIRVHASGILVHPIGLIWLEGRYISANTWPLSAAADRAIRMCGGNRQRGLMCLALSLASEQPPNR